MTDTTIRTKLIGVTQPVIGTAASTPEELISYCARVSNPSNQSNFKTSGDLLRYCIKNKHWSIFGMVNVVVEVEAPRDITRQLLRHSSLEFQEFSQRYSDEISFTNRSFRSQDTKNRQNSIDNMDAVVLENLQGSLNEVSEVSKEAYSYMLGQGAAKECARVILPEGLTMSRLYVNGTVRSWLHYLEVREEIGVTQLEHVEMANKIREVIEPAFPVIFNL